MSRSKPNSFTIAALLAFSSLALVACHKSVDGKYQDGTGMFTIVFNSGKAEITAAGVTTESDYTVSGNQITFTGNGQTYSVTQQPDGTITGFPGVDKLTKIGG